MNKILYLDKINSDGKGDLSVFNSNIEIPFDIKRIYYICNVKKDVDRGSHAHKELQQLLWCPHGEIDVFLDNGKEKKTFKLDMPNKCLLVGSGVWRVMSWKKSDSVLCVAASNYYDEEDYIRDYDKFKEYVERGFWENENKF